MAERITKKHIERLAPHYAASLGLPADRLVLDYAAIYGGYSLHIAPIGQPYNIEYTINSSRMSIMETYRAMHFAIDTKYVSDLIAKNEEKVKSS